MSQANVIGGLKNLSSAGLGAPLLLVMMLAMLVVPLPPWLLDIFLPSIFRYPWWYCSRVSMRENPWSSPPFQRYCWLPLCCGWR